MKLQKSAFVFSIILIGILFVNFASAQYSQSADTEECTIGVASGRATPDGHPLLWKTRDTSDRNNGIYYFTSRKLKYITVLTVGSTTAWMGVNEKGFAIMNSNSADLESGSSGPGNGTVMSIALGSCATVADFEHFLDSTNVTGRTTHANFGVIDSTGAAAIFETAGYEYWKFDANDTINAPEGYVLRTNFAFNGAASGGITGDIYSTERYFRQEQLISDFYSGDSLTYKSILRYQMRDFSDFDSDPVPVPFPQKWLSYRPYGYIYCDVSICRTTSVSAVVIKGVLPHESAKLTTMWTILGQPAGAIAVPYWPVGQVPDAANGYSSAPLCNYALYIRSLLFDYPENSSYIDSYKLLDGEGGGVWMKSFPAEDSIFVATEEKLAIWRSEGFEINDMLQTETELANYALNKLRYIYQGMITSVESIANETVPENFVLKQNYPNPFNASTTIQFVLPKISFVELKIYNTLGKEVETIAARNFMSGLHTLNWNANGLASGVYLFRLEATASDGSDSFRQTRKLHLIK